ncbi:MULTISPECIES: AAA family ATPase [Streptomyces]|uniref:AAA family ATPase n=1 Tax=Streptomyces xinghaiensis TaxID=1038928 RepID=A0A3R7LR03_9ACTN|nr:MULTISPECIES: AAA family ATPase [Streptomyces]PQM24401.1 ATP-binding protein [Streptomyces xinghaiensis]RKM98069.1 AAA family ATPase [Streptomyces xinghaiensis]RNC75236.1 AAA family ATPase [Streptomyces xinghaiensis]
MYAITPPAAAGPETAAARRTAAEAEPSAGPEAAAEWTASACPAAGADAAGADAVGADAAGADAAETDLRGRRPSALRYPAGDVLVVSGLPGSGKSTLIKRATAALDARGGAVHRIDSQDARDRWQRRLPAALPYALYRPLVRAAHYAGLRRALRSGASVVVHDCGTLTWVRRWLARDARRRGRGLHLALLDVSPETALAGQLARGRGVSGYAFARHRRAVARLIADAEAGRAPEGCVSVVLLDRASASALHTIGFG